MRKPIKLEYEIEVRDREGRLLRREKRESKSWVMNFIKMLYALMRVAWGDVGTTLTDYTGTSVNYPSGGTSQYAMKLEAGSGDDDWGIQVGSGDTPVSSSDYKLDSLISHGTGAGQLQYGACSVGSPYEEAGYLKMKIERTFTNGSGGSITVKEIGLMAVVPGTYALIARDVLSTPTTIPDGGTQTVRYIISMAV